MSDFEEQYFDVLQNIEFAIVNTFHQHPELVDLEVEAAVNALVSQYKAEQRGRTAVSPQLAPLGGEVFSAVKGMCEWRLGREGLISEQDKSEMVHPDPVSLDEVVACLQRIRKSIRLWTKQGGRQGYLTFVDQFIR